MATPELSALLIHAQLLTSELARRAVTATAGTSTSWLEHLVQARLIDDAAVAQCAGRAAFLPTCDLVRLAAVPPEVLAHVPWDLAIEHRVVPLAIEADGDLRLAMVDPYDTVAMTELEFFLGRRLLREVAPATAMARALTTYYRAPSTQWHVTARAARSHLRTSRPIAPMPVLQAA